MDPFNRAAARCMLQRGPAFRTKSWVWPGPDEAASTGDADVGAVAVWRGKRQDPLGIRIFRRRNVRLFVRVCGR